MLNSERSAFIIFITRFNSFSYFPQMLRDGKSFPAVTKATSAWPSIGKQNQNRRVVEDFPAISSSPPSKQSTTSESHTLSQSLAQNFHGASGKCASFQFMHLL